MTHSPWTCMHVMRRLVPSLALMGTFVSAAAIATPFQIKPAESIFAVVTHKKGVAAKLAHNHIVYATKFSATLDVDESLLEKSSLSVTIPSSSLEIDTPEAQKKWFPEFKKLGILTEEFSEVSPKDRAEVKKTMLGESQLDAARFQEISAKVTALQKAPGKVGAEKFTHTATVSVTVHGKTVQKTVPIVVSLQGNTLQARAVGNYKFTEFGIEPYSAFLGAVANKDDFHIYVSILAEKG